MSKRQTYKRPSYEELESMVRLGSIKVASWRFCGNPRCKDIIRKWCKELDIPIPTSKVQIKIADLDVLLRYLNEHGEVEQASAALGVTAAVIRRWMKYYRIRRSHDTTGKSERFEQFSKPVS